MSSGIWIKVITQVINGRLPAVPKPELSNPTSFSELCQHPPPVSGQEGRVRVCGVSSVKTAHLGRPVAGSTGNQVR
ncbi:MAG: hypothetical protein FRX49_11286 [Trebouxia sp. A1-2]|nr:MAG: hypothetical protein FRX49_11286 [Trebouxia sp. A1-2]